MHVYSCTRVCICQHNQVFHPDNEAPTGGLSLIAALNFNPPQEVGYTHTHTLRVGPLLTASGYLLATPWLQGSLQLSGQLLFT